MEDPRSIYITCNWPKNRQPIEEFTELQMDSYNKT